MLLDTIVITPITLKPAAKITARCLSTRGSVLLSAVKWDTEPGGLCDFCVSTDLQNWTFSRSLTDTGNTFGVTSITQPSTRLRYFCRVTRQQ